MAGPATEAVAQMMQQSVGVVPEGLPVSTVGLSDDYDPVALWMRAHARPFFDREGYGGGSAGPTAAVPGYGYPPPRGWQAGPAARSY